jgi:hypothetical protein
MDDVERGGAAGAETSNIGAVAAPGRERRMTAGRKRNAVLRALRGEPLEIVARELAVTAADLSGWREAFLEDVQLLLDDPDAVLDEVAQTVDGDHGRIETRRGKVLHDEAWLAERHGFSGLHDRYYLLSTPLSAARFSTSSWTRTGHPPARTTDPRTSPDCAASRSTSSAPTRRKAPREAKSSAPHGTMRSYSSFSPRPNAIALPPSVLSALASLRWAMVSVGYDQSQQCFIEYKTYCHPDTLRRARRRSDRQAFEPLRQLPPAPTPTPSAVAMSDYPVASRALPPCNSSRSAPKNQRLRLRLGTVCGKRGS